MDQSPVFVHAADLHLGAPLRRLGEGLDPTVREELTRLVDSAFDNLIDMTIEVGAEFLVLAGDIYDGVEREARAQIRFAEGLRRLVDAGIGVYMVHGNHDPLTNQKVDVVRLPDEVVVFESGPVQSHRHDLRDGGHVLVCGVSFARIHESENLALRFRGVERQDALTVIGVLHANVGGANSGHGDYSPCRPSDLETGPVDYWALGHVHKRQVKRFGDRRFWAYSGNLQGRDAGERGPKGALVVPIVPGGVEEPRFVALDEFRFETLQIDCSAMANLTDISADIDRQLNERSNDLPLVVRVELHGRSLAVKATEKVRREKTTLESALQQLCAASLNGGYIEEVDNRLLPPVDLESLREENSLVGDVLRDIDALDESRMMEILGSEHPVFSVEHDLEEMRRLMVSFVVDELVVDEEDNT